MNRLTRIVAVSGAAVIAMVVISSCTTSSPSSSTSASSAAPASTPTPSADPTLLAMKAWWDGGASAITNSFITDTQQLSSAASQSSLGQEVTAVPAACTAFRSDIERAQAYAPLPVPALEKTWAAALAEYSPGTTDCLAGVNNLDTSLIVQAANEISAGTADLNTLTTQLTQLGP